MRFSADAGDPSAPRVQQTLAQQRRLPVKLHGGLILQGHKRAQNHDAHRDPREHAVVRCGPLGDLARALAVGVLVVGVPVVGVLVVGVPVVGVLVVGVPVVVVFVVVARVVS
jgi:hypothetical protein